MSQLNNQHKKILASLDDIVDLSKIRLNKLNEELITIKTLQKDINTLRKYTKESKRKKTKVHMKQYASAELYRFMGFPYPVKLAKVDVMKYICQYISYKGLKLHANKRYFQTNKELSRLFKVRFKTSLSTIEIMKYIHPHFEPENRVKISQMAHQEFIM